MTDEIKVEGTPPVAPSPAQTNPDGTPSLESPVPYSRFQEVIKEKNQNKEALDTLKGEFETFKNAHAPQPVIEEEPSDWKEGADRIVKKSVEAMEQKQLAKSKLEADNAQAIQADFDNLRKMGKEIPKEVEAQVLKEMIKSGSKSVLSTYAELESSESFKEKIQQQKAEGFVPKAGAGGQINTQEFDYSEIRGKSLEEIEAEGT